MLWAPWQLYTCRPERERGPHSGLRPGRHWHRLSARPVLAPALDILVQTSLMILEIPSLLLLLLNWAAGHLPAAASALMAANISSSHSPWTACYIALSTNPPCSIAQYYYYQQIHVMVHSFQTDWFKKSCYGKSVVYLTTILEFVPELLREWKSRHISEEFSTSVDTQWCMPGVSQRVDPVQLEEIFAELSTPPKSN